MTNEENKKALEAAMFLSEFCYTQDECKDCIFRRDYDCCCILKDECMSWQEDNYLIDLLAQFDEENSQ